MHVKQYPKAIVNELQSNLKKSITYEAFEWYMKAYGGGHFITFSTSTVVIKPVDLRKILKVDYDM